MRNRMLWTVGAIAALTLSGCGGGSANPPPTTHPVKGKIVSKSGPSLAGGAVEFQSVTDRSLLTRGAIQPDGSFTLETMHEGKKYPGAVAGSHKVTILPPMGEDQTAQPILLPTPVTVQPRENEFTLDVPPARRP